MAENCEMEQCEAVHVHQELVEQVNAGMRSEEHTSELQSLYS